MADNIQNDLDKEVLNLVDRTISKHTCQVFTKGEKYDYEPYGSGVLVRIDQFYFIFSASHVLKKIENEDLFINTNEGMQPIIGAVELTNVDKHDNIDVAYAFLGPDFGKELEKKYLFLTKEFLGKKYDDSASIFATMGYPADNIREDKEQKTILTKASFVVHPLAKDHVYEYYGYTRDLHYVLQYAGKGTDMNTSAKKKINKAPHGVSGGGLWQITFFEDENSNITLDYQLIGIVFERQTKYFVHIANKIDIILLGIQNKIGIKV